MSERKTVRIWTGHRELVMTPSEYVKYISNLPKAAADAVQVLSGPIEASYVNSEGKIVQERLTGSQVANRINLGEQPVLLGANDPRRDAKRRQDAGQIKKNIADDANGMALHRAVNPWYNLIPGAAAAVGVGFRPIQDIEEWAVGSEEAKRARAEISEANPVLDLVGTGIQSMGLLALGGGGALGAKARITAEIAAFETSHYTRHIMEQDLPFVAEDLGRNIATGMLFASPLYVGALAKGPIVKGLRKLNEKASSAAATETVGNLLSAGAVISAKGSGKSASFARGSAATKLLGRAYNKLFGSKRGPVVGVSKEVIQQQKKLKNQGGTIGSMTEQRLRTTPIDEIMTKLDDIDEFLPDAKVTKRLREIDYGNLSSGLGGIRSSVEGVRKVSLGINKQIGKLNKKGFAEEWTKEGAAAWSTQADNVFYSIENHGFGDIAGHLKDTLQAKNPTSTYGRWVQARLDASLMTSRGGALEVSQEIGRFLQDEAAWGKAGRAGKNINKAIDQIADSYNQLQVLNIPSKTDDIVTTSARLENINKHIANLESAYEVLREAGLLDYEKLRGIKNSITEAGNKIAGGTKAYNDLVALNKARKAAATRHSTESASVRRTIEELTAETEKRIGEEVTRMQTFGNNALEWLVKGHEKTVSATNLGVMAFNKLDDDERDALFHEVTALLPSLIGNPEAMEEAMGDYLGPASITAPQLAGMAGQQAAQTMYWLSSQMPRQDRSLYGKNLSPGRAKRDEFLEKLVASIDPMSVSEAALVGGVTKGMVDAFRVTNPSLYAHVGVLVSEIIEQADPIEAPRKVVNGLNQLLGGIDPLYRGPALLQLQTNYAQTGMQQQVSGGAGGMPNSSNPQKPGNNFTFAQRIASY